tara:strand:+ start:77 stop:421 length:345 start_codon:yes stop_codon:yes gene_type:complete
MHEVSLVQSIFRTLESEFEEEELDRLSQIDLKVGVLSNVEPILMQNAFSAVTETNNRFKSVKLHIDKVPILIQCDLCGEISQVENYVFKCSNGHPSKNVIQGEELLIERVHFND